MVSCFSLEPTPMPPLVRSLRLVVVRLTTGAVADVPRKVTSTLPNRIRRVLPSNGWLTTLLLLGLPATARTWLATMPILSPRSDCCGTKL